MLLVVASSKFPGRGQNKTLPLSTPAAIAESGMLLPSIGSAAAERGVSRARASFALLRALAEAQLAAAQGLAQSVERAAAPQGPPCTRFPKL